MNNKHVTEDEVRLIIDAESSKAQQAIHELEKESRNLREENSRRLNQLLKLQSQRKEETEEYKNLRKIYDDTRKKISSNAKEIANLTKNIDTNCLTMRQLRTEAKRLQRQLDNTAQALNPEEYAQLEKQLSKVNERIAALKQNAKSLKESLQDDATYSFMLGSALVKFAELIGSTAKNWISSLKETADESVELARSADGVTKAFDELNRPNLLDNLRKATKGTVDDISLMKAAVQAKDFRIPLEDMGKYLAFAQLKAQQTGQSVEYMTNSIVTGLGRKSVMILDNLGLSAAEINERIKETGSFMKAVASIVDEQLAAAGKAYVSAADRALQRTTALKNAQKELGDALLPLREQYEDTYGQMQIGTIGLMKWIIKHHDAVAALTVAIIGLAVASAAQSTALKTNIIVTKGAAAGHLMLNNVMLTGKAIKLLTIALIQRINAGMLLMRGNTIGAARATVQANTAMKVFNTTCRANVIGLVVTGLVAAITYFGLFSSSADKAKAKTKELSDTERELSQVRKETNSQLMKDIATLSKFKGSKKQEIELVKQMNAKYGESIGYYKSVKEWYEALVNNSKLYCDQMVNEARARMAANRIAELEEQKRQLTTDDNGKTRKYSRQRKTRDKLRVDEFGNTVYDGKEEVAGSSDLEKAQANYNKLNRQSQAEQKKLNQLIKEGAENAKKLHTGGNVDPFANTDAANKKDDKNSKEDAAAIKTFQKQRQEDLDEAKRSYQEDANALKQALADKRLTKEAYNMYISQLTAEHAGNLQAIEQAYYEQSQKLQLHDGEKKAELTAQQKKNLETATQQSFDARLKLQEEYNTALVQIEQAGAQAHEMTLQEKENAELALLDGYYQAALDRARIAGEEEVALTEAYEKAKSSILNKYAQLQAEQENDENKKLGAIKTAWYENTTLEEMNREIERLEQLHEAGIISEEEYQKKLAEIRKNSWMAYFNQFKELASNAISALQDAELANVDAKYDAEIEAARKAGKDTTALEEKKANEKLKVEKKYADVQFAIKASEIIANTAVSIMMAYKQLGPILGSVAAALMGVTGAAQLAVAKAERDKVKRMTLNGSSGATGTAARVATGREEGGYVDVEREQDGRRFHARYDPRRRGYVDRPTVIVGEGPAGQSKEWVASNATVENPTVKPVLDVIDQAQRAGTVRSLDLGKVLLQQQGLARGGYADPTRNSQGTTSGATPAATDQRLMQRLADVLERMEQDGIPALVGLDQVDAAQKLREQAQKIASK